MDTKDKVIIGGPFQLTAERVHKTLLAITDFLNLRLEEACNASSLEKDLDEKVLEKLSQLIAIKSLYDDVIVLLSPTARQDLEEAMKLFGEITFLPSQEESQKKETVH